MKLQQLPKKDTQEVIRRHQKVEKGNAGYFYLLLTIILFTIGWIVLMKVIDFSNKHEIVKNSIVQAQFKWPLEIREKEEAKVVEKMILPEYPLDQVDTPLKTYICNKFGIYDCKIALGIAQAESGFREDAININTNDTIDVGIFQINSVHFKQEGCSLKDIVDEYKNVDCAFSIFKASGWGAWSAFKNDSYLAHLD